jgi:hypothetical protein
MQLPLTNHPWQLLWICCIRFPTSSYISTYSCSKIYRHIFSQCKLINRIRIISIDPILAKPLPIAQCIARTQSIFIGTNRMEGKMVHRRRRDNKWHPYTSFIKGGDGHDHRCNHATGVGVPFIILPLPTSPVAGSTERGQTTYSLKIGHLTHSKMKCLGV